MDREQRLNKAKEAMAVAANALLSGPEDHVGELRTLVALLGDADMQASATGGGGAQACRHALLGGADLRASAAIVGCPALICLMPTILLLTS